MANRICLQEDEVIDVTEEFAPEVHELLDRYVNVVMLLKQFFAKLNYCSPHCLAKDRYKVGCCSFNHYEIHPVYLKYPAFRLLNQQRHLKYGLPHNTEQPTGHGFKPCRYHTPQGCIIEEFFTPLCIAHLCDKGVEYAKRYGVYYDPIQIMGLLGDLLTGSLSDEDYQQIVATLNLYIQAVTEAQ